MDVLYMTHVVEDTRGGTHCQDVMARGSMREVTRICSQETEMLKNTCPRHLERSSTQQQVTNTSMLTRRSMSEQNYFHPWNKIFWIHIKLMQKVFIRENHHSISNQDSYFLSKCSAKSNPFDHNIFKRNMIMKLNPFIF